jgi:hypothetical protein
LFSTIRTCPPNPSLRTKFQDDEYENDDEEGNIAYFCR